ncbi:MAG: CHASE2 domain-containing protein [Caulobacterales bacterium]
MERGLAYWAIALTVLVVSLAATPFLNRHLGLPELREKIFQTLGQSGPRALRPRYVKVVMIGDDDYWKGEPAGQSPLNRNYLAKLIKALDQDNVALIALDVDESLDDPTQAVSPGQEAALPPEQRASTEALMKAIGAAAENRSVVLARTFVDGKLALSADAYQLFGICVRPLAGGQWDNPGAPPGYALSPNAKSNITCGHNSPMKDALQVPPEQGVEGAAFPVDSFALAIARAWSPPSAARIGDQAFFATYLQPKDQADTVVTAGQVLAGDPAVVRALRFKPVIIGGGWSRSGYHSGPTVDTYPTPVGDMSGVLMHESWAEAILDGHLINGMPPWLLEGLEAAFALFATVLFARYAGLLVKLGLFVGLALLLLLVQWLMLNLAGVFFDASFPLLGVAVHSIIDRLVEERKEAAPGAAAH